MSIIDDNREYVAMGVTDDANATPTPLKVDPVTNRLIISLTQRTETPVANTVLPTDENRTPVAEVVTNANLVTAVASTPIKGGVIRVIDSATGDIARTTSGWIEDEKYGWYCNQQATAWSVEYDSAVTRTGRLTLKLSTTDVTGKIRVTDTLQGSGVALTAPADFSRVKPVKASTQYRFRCYAKTTNAATNAVYVGLVAYTSAGAAITTSATNKLTGTQDWTLLEVIFTTGATTVFESIRFFNDVAGNISDAWFDVNSMTLEEVSTLTNAGSTPALFYPRVTAVTSSDNVGDNLDYVGAYAHTYTPPTSINENATNRQTLAITKKHQTGIRIWPVSAGTGDWTVTVHDASNNVIGTPCTIANASVTTGAMLTFLNSFDWTTGTYHFHVTSTVADGTLKCNTAND